MLLLLTLILLWHPISSLCVTGCATGQCACFATFQECVTQDDANGLCTMTEAGIWLLLAIACAVTAVLIVLVVCLCCCCCCSRRWCCCPKKKRDIHIMGYMPAATGNKGNNVALGEL